MATPTTAVRDHDKTAGEPTPQLLAALGNERMRVLGQIVGLLTRSQPHQGMTVADMKRGILAPVLLGQYIMAGRSAEDGAGTPPAAVLLWARVSEAVDARLTAAQSTRIEIATAEWNCGDIVWLTDAIGDLRAIPQMVARIREADPSVRAIRVASASADGKVSIRTL